MNIKHENAGYIISRFQYFYYVYCTYNYNYSEMLESGDLGTNGDLVSLVLAETTAQLSANSTTDKVSRKIQYERSWQNVGLES